MKLPKIDITGIDIEIEPEAALEYIQHRINKKKPLTQRAFNQAMTKALSAHEVGMTPTELIDWTVEKGWDGINLAYTKNALASEMQATMQATAIPHMKNVNQSGMLGNYPSTKTKDQPILKQLSDDSWAN